jgi:hypothetical protein
MDSQPVPPKQGAIIGGWLCFAIGMGVMYFSLWLMPIYAAALLVAFVLSIVALAQRRILGGLVLLLVTIIVPLIVWFRLTGERLDARFANDPNYQAGKKLGRALVKAELADEPEKQESREAESARPVAIVHESPKPNETVVTETAATPRETKNPAESAVQIESPAPGASPPVVVPEHRSVTSISVDTIPLIYELRASKSTPRTEIAMFVTRGGFQGMDEFARREFLEKLDRLIAEKKAQTGPDHLFQLTSVEALGEYDFEKNAFPLNRNRDGSPLPKVMYYVSARSTVVDDRYAVAFENLNQLHSLPVPLEEARLLGPVLRKSRVAEIRYSGSLASCEELRGDQENAKVVSLSITEVVVQLREGGKPIVYKVPSQLAAEAKPASASAKQETVPMEAAPAPKVVALSPQAQIAGGGLRKVQEEEAPAAGEAAASRHVVTGVPPGDSLNARSAPAMNSEAVFVLNNGAKVSILGAAVKNGETEWIPVSFGSQKGWVRGKYLKPADPREIFESQ